MIVRKNLQFKSIMGFAGHHAIWLAIWMTIITSFYYYSDWKWVTMPWFPLSVIGTAVAFYVGFKNNQAYGRLWEARKIWGAIVNSSRMFGSIVQSNLANKYPVDAQKLIYQKIAWLYTFRDQLLIPTQWEHVSAWGSFGYFNKNRRKKYGEGAFENQVDKTFIEKYFNSLKEKNTSNANLSATQILHQQTKLIQSLYDEGKIEWFKQVELQKIINDFFEHQGKLERLKKFPLPRQYGSFSFIFVCIFIFLLPFGLLGELKKFNPDLIWLTIPVGVVVGWVYVVMELVGDYSENPFEGLPNDIPMLSITRTIEIDLLQMLGEVENLPKPIIPQKGVLM